jgi:signal transduction histidine kinase
VSASGSAIESLVRFTRIAAGSEEPEVVLDLLAETALAHSTAAAAATLRLRDDGSIALVASRNLPKRLVGWSAEVDSIDEELGGRLCAAAGKRCVASRVLPLMSHQALFGALVLLYSSAAAAEAETLEVARSLADLAATSFGRSFQYRELQRAYDELRASREAQARAYKLGVLGQMAAGVAHDLKNFLNPISIHLTLLERRVGADDSDARESIAAMRDVVKRGVATIDRLRDFSRQQPERENSPQAIDPLVEQAVEMARARIVSTRRYQLALRTELGAPPPVAVAPDELVSAVVNLVVNSIDAMAEKGTSITVATGVSGGEVFVRVSDDGPGIAPEVARRIFEPFFTTKGEAGTGLGLANVYAFARRFGGDVTLDTKVGEGASFTIRLPHHAGA